MFLISGALETEKATRQANTECTVKSLRLSLEFQMESKECWKSAVNSCTSNFCKLISPFFYCKLFPFCHVLDYRRFHLGAQSSEKSPFWTGWESIWVKWEIYSKLLRQGEARKQLVKTIRVRALLFGVWAGAWGGVNGIVPWGEFHVIAY